MPTLGIAREFLREFGKLQRNVQDRVYETFDKFEEATFAGVHLEKIRDVRDPRLRSIRVDQSWRGIVLAPTSGDSYLLLRVLPHDEAYRWARRKSLSVNRATGSIEMLPEPQYDALIGLAAGMSPEEVWAEIAGTLAPGDYDPDDVTAPDRAGRLSWSVVRTS